MYVCMCVCAIEIECVQCVRETEMGTTTHNNINNNNNNINNNNNNNNNYITDSFLRLVP